MYKAKGGMRLTNSTLATFLKYPLQSTETVGKNAEQNASRKKFGVFQAEMPALTNVAKATGLIRRKGFSKVWCRHPLAFLMEAADDICYRIVDLEDGFRLNRVSYKEAHDLLREIATEINQGSLDERSDELAKIGYLRAIAIRVLVEQTVEVFLDNEKQMLTGKFDQPLCELVGNHQTLRNIRTLMKKSVYNAQSVLETEAAGFQIIPGLLDLFWSAVSSEKTYRNHRRAEKVLQIIPPDFRGPAGKSSAQVYERLLRITDYVSGMTDSYALSLYRKLNGIALPN